MGKKFDITNCSPNKCVIQLGQRHIHPDQTAYSVDEAEVNSGVMNMVKSGHLKMVKSIGKKAALKKTNLDRPILQSPQKSVVKRKVAGIMKPRGITLSDLKKFPWLSTMKKEQPKKTTIEMGSKDVDSVIEIKPKENGTVEISAVYKKRDSIDEKLAKAKKACDEKEKSALDADIPKVNVEEIVDPKPKQRRRRKKNVSNS